MVNIGYDMKSNYLGNGETGVSMKGIGGPKSESAIGDMPKTLISNSKAMQVIGDYIDTVSRTNTPVLILGESGVGKELIAKTIHYRSRRSDQAFVKVDCAGLPGSNIERELFGYEKGAIAGTKDRREGSLKIANGGTLFMEEIGALSPLLQAKLCLFLKNNEFEKIGGKKPVKVDVRIVASTAQNLERLIGERKFSEDLYYELNVFPIIVPPLRERNEDLILLINFFVAKYANEAGEKMAMISDGAFDALMNYHWPGNVQKLKGCIKRAMILSTGNLIHIHHLPPSLRGDGSPFKQIIQDN